MVQFVSSAFIAMALGLVLALTMSLDARPYPLPAFQGNVVNADSPGLYPPLNSGDDRSMQSVKYTTPPVTMPTNTGSSGKEKVIDLAAPTTKREAVQQKVYNGLQGLGRWLGNSTISLGAGVAGFMVGGPVGIAIGAVGSVANLGFNQARKWYREHKGEKGSSESTQTFASQPISKRQLPDQSLVNQPTPQQPDLKQSLSTPSTQQLVIPNQQFESNPPPPGYIGRPSSYGTIPA